jgi:crotonobetainyl-CoA:carnitine CoA-transferase CaiB-like acyl-CoA transferase
LSDEDYLFSRLKVLDVGTWVAGPVAGTILADFGAQVIKVEMPGVGDAYRGLSALPVFPDADENYMWQMDARNKRSLTLNLKTPEGIEILHRLIRGCDVYITNQPLPMRRALNLNYQDIQPLNETMIYASLTAYGEEGPEKDREGFDLVAYWARSGLMDLVRTGDAAPAPGIPGMGDHPTAVALYAAIVTALLKRERTGQGSRVHTSLLANGLWSSSCVAQGGFAGGNFENFRAARRAPAFTRNLYETRDLRWLQFTMVRTPAEVEQLLKVVGLGGLLDDERFATQDGRARHGESLVQLFQDLLKERDSDEWLQIFSVEGINATRMGIIEELMEDEQLKINHYVVPHNDSSVKMPYVINHPIKVDALDQVGPERAPDLGEHTDEILQELGFDPEAVAALRSKGGV